MEERQGTRHSVAISADGAGIRLVSIHVYARSGLCQGESSIRGCLLSAQQLKKQGCDRVVLSVAREGIGVSRLARSELVPEAAERDQ